MLRYIEKENKKLGFKYKDYYLPQGDSFSLRATESNGEEQLISRLVFKLGLAESDCKINPVFQQEFAKAVDGSWVCKVSGEETAKWKPTCACDAPYVYEIEGYYIDEEPTTLRTGNFTIEPQIGGE
ncbi:MAG: hypothetical protein IJ371_02840 [Clostridia bacterium]|nr:hypothetical protein [Clostridia bacterium]